MKNDGLLIIGLLGLAALVLSGDKNTSNISNSTLVTQTTKKTNTYTPTNTILPGIVYSGAAAPGAPSGPSSTAPVPFTQPIYYNPTTGIPELV